VFSRRVILTRWIAAIEFASTLAVILTAWIAAIEFAHGALGRIMLKKNQLVKMTN